MKIEPLILVDSREKTPWTFSLPTERATLATGDYTVKHLSHMIAIERKSLPDFIGCLGHGRERFIRELERLRGIRYRCLILECDLAEIERGDWRGKLTPNHILGALASWSGKYMLPIFLAGNAESAARLAEKFLVQSCKHVVNTYEPAAEFLEGAA